MDPAAGMRLAAEGAAKLIAVDDDRALLPWLLMVGIRMRKKATPLAGWLSFWVGRLTPPKRG
jgi:hypothetical protein